MTRRRLLQSVALAGAAAVALTQTSSGIITPDVRRVGQRLACLCGVCNHTGADCLEGYRERIEREMEKFD